MYEKRPEELFDRHMRHRINFDAVNQQYSGAIEQYTMMYDTKPKKMYERPKD